MNKDAVMGTVKWFDTRRGFGFVSDEDGADYFVHFSRIRMEGFKKLTTGQAVEFIPSEDENGRAMAEEVCPCEAE